MVKSSKIQEAVLGYLSDAQSHSVHEIKKYLADIRLGEYSEGQFAGSINTLLRNRSIDKVDRGVYIIRSIRMKKCFVVSPIGEDGSSIRENADKLFKHIIKPVCENCGFDAIRVDQLNDANSITQTIIKHLEESDLVLADISGYNPNVFYEMGYRTRTKKPIIHLKKKDEKLPFDINTIRTYEYDLTDLDNVVEIKERLINAINSFSYTSFDNESVDDKETGKDLSDIMPVLYQILDSISELHKEVKNANSDTIKTVIKSMQDMQPQVSPETALQMQLIGSILQNPESIIKLSEISKNLPKS